MSEISDKAQQELFSWPRVTMHNPRFGGVEFCINRMEIEHLYGDQLADLSSILGGRSHSGQPFL